MSTLIKASIKQLAKALAPIALAGICVVPALAHPTIDVAASNWKFTPNHIVAYVGEETTLRLTSTGGVHGVQSDELGIKLTAIRPNEFVEVTFTPKKTGTYKIPCAIVCGPGHADMALTIEVQEHSTASSATSSATVSAAPAASGGMMKPAEAMRMPAMDRQFLAMVVQHDRLTDRMANLGSTRSRRLEIRSLAKRIAADELAQIKQANSLYQKWYHAEMPAMPMQGMPTGGQMMPDWSVAALKNAPDFDRAFVLAMLTRSQMAQCMAAGALARSHQPEVRKLAVSIEQTHLEQTSQIWRAYQRWYPQGG